MDKIPLHIVILAGGDSKRIGTGGPKALLDLCGLPLIEHIFRACKDLDAASYTLVLGPTHRPLIENWLVDSDYSGWNIVEQPQALGTGDAVRCALDSIDGDGQILVLCGDTPLIESETLELLISQGNSMLTAEVDSPYGLGRIIRSDSGELIDIVEEVDADETQLEINEINSGVYVLDIASLRESLQEASVENNQNEIYLTHSAVSVLKSKAGSTITLPIEESDQVLGVNTLSEFAWVTRLMREKILEEHLSFGVILDDPSTIFIEVDVAISPGVRVMPFSVLRKGVRVGKDCVVGPFAHLRSGVEMMEDSVVGNFVEVKNTTLEAGVKVKHLTYLGDAHVGKNANIGCGTITANYDGRNKHPTKIGDDAFIGSGSILIAPVNIGNKSTVAAGAVVTARHHVLDGETVAGVPARKFSK